MRKPENESISTFCTRGIINRKLTAAYSIESDTLPSGSKQPDTTKKNTQLGMNSGYKTTTAPSQKASMSSKIGVHPSSPRCHQVLMFPVLPESQTSGGCIPAFRSAWKTFIVAHLDEVCWGGSGYEV
jgi:hypothetical protein